MDKLWSQSKCNEGQSYNYLHAEHKLAEEEAERIVALDPKKSFDQCHEILRYKKTTRFFDLYEAYWYALKLLRPYTITSGLMSATTLQHLAIFSGYLLLAPSMANSDPRTRGSFVSLRQPGRYRERCSQSYKPCSIRDTKTRCWPHTVSEQPTGIGR